MRNNKMSARAEIDIDIMMEAGDWPAEAALERLAADAVRAVGEELALKASQPVELSLVFTDDENIRVLNAEWRDKDKPTNVLSFPAFDMKIGDDLPVMLGDIILSAETVRREAEQEGKVLDHHITHLIVHGLLHLLGHDHEEDEQADLMEETERRVLARLAIADPYA